MKKRSHWDYLEPTHLIGGAVNAVVYSGLFVLIGATVGAVTGQWWWALVGVPIGPIMSWCDIREALKRRQRIWEGEA